MKRLIDEGEKLTVFNSLSWDREDYVFLNTYIEGSQKTDDGYLVRVKVPSVGYSEVKIVNVNPVKVDGLTMENEYLRVVLDEKGKVVSLYDKENQREVLKASSNRLVIYENIPGWADAWDIEPSYKDTQFELNAEKYEVREKGPLRACIRFYYNFRNSIVTQDTCLYAKSRRVDFKTTVQMLDRELLLKSWFFFNLNVTEATFEIPYGILKRPTTKNTSWEKAKFEVPFMKWLDLSEDDYGVAILNNGKYGTAVEGANVGISLAKTPIYPDYATDTEINTFIYSVYPHKGDWKEAKVYQRAYELNYPLRAVKGKGGEKSFIKVSPDNLILEAMKKSEDGKGLVLRLYNVLNKRGKGEVELWFKPREAQLVNILENNIPKDIRVEGEKLKFDYRNYQIISVKVT
jgi:alpha-mannosidase